MPKSGLRKYTLNGGLLMLPPPPLTERGLSVSALTNSFCLAVCLSAGIGGKRVLSAALKRLGAANAASNAIANVFLISSSLNVIGSRPFGQSLIEPILDSGRDGANIQAARSPA